jgi:DNA repair photolyase
VLERNPAILRDLDLLKAIHEKARAVVAFSIISTPDSKNYNRVCQMEHLAPPSKKRFAAMENIAAEGIPVGVCMMPILPGLCDDAANIEAVVRWTADHGGTFVLASGLTLSDQQKIYFYNMLGERFPNLLSLYQRLYPPKSYSQTGNGWHETAIRVRDVCTKYGIRDRMPRPIIPGEKRALNKRVVEALADRLYEMELNREEDHKVWAYRNAAWAIEDMEQDAGLIYHSMGLKGLQSIPKVDPSLGQVIANLIEQTEKMEVLK